MASAQSSPAHSSPARASPAHSLPAPADLKCHICDKEFKYRKALLSHEQKHAEDEARVKREPVDPDPEPDGDMNGDVNGDADGEDAEEDDEGEEDDLTCDICEKMFSYRRVLEQHKRTKHNMSSGTKRAKITLKDCSVRCLLCDVEMKVSAINDHNQNHIAKNIKPRNVYTCAECELKFKSCSNLATHIKLVHRLKQREDQVPQRYIGTSVADFCEVVVTKAEPPDEVRSRDGTKSEVPRAAAVDLGGLSCHVCGKKMPTLVSLKRHINWHVNVGDRIENEHECFVCKEKFRFRCHYKLHMRSHYADPALDAALLTCETCGRRSKNLRAARAHMNYHKQTRFRSGDYECSICKRVFRNRRVYLSHMAVHFRRGDSARSCVIGDADAAAPADGPACPLCGKACASPDSLKHHLAWHNSKGVLYGARHECALCHLQFTNKRRLELHTRAHYEDDAGPHRCPVCGKGYSDESYMRRHLKAHNFEHASHRARLERLRRDKVRCGECARAFSDGDKLARHVRRAHAAVKQERDVTPPPESTCELCARRFPDERRLRLHLLAHRRKPTYLVCKFCGKKNQAKRHTLHVKSHLTRKHTDSPLRCPRCPETFVLGYALHYHLRDAHGVLETWAAAPASAPAAASAPASALQCPLCPKTLASEGNFERHLDYHDSLRCNYCSERFATPRFLEGHVAFSCEKRRLVGDSEPHARRIRCPRCRKPFHLRIKLECHMRVCHGERCEPRAEPAAQHSVCDYCFRSFEDAGALATHRIYHRTVAYYGCKYCARKFSTLSAFRRHRSQHLYRLECTACDVCGAEFPAFRDMIEHRAAAHPDLADDWLVLPKESVEETCPICGKSFHNLHRHLDYHEENRCKKCGEYFSSHDAFDSHLCALASDEEAPAGEPGAGAPPPAHEECKFCFKPITRRDSRRKHDVLHTTSGSISCRFCELKFKTIDSFNAHAFSHRSRKYTARPLRCRRCPETFVRYGPFVRHLRAAHACRDKMHYRARARLHQCVVCGGRFPNLHNHYRAHLAHRCAACLKYVSSARLFAAHRCDAPDAEPDKVFTSDADLPALIRSYVPEDETDDEKYVREEDDDPRTQEERSLHAMVQSPIISDVLSLYAPESGPAPLSPAPLSPAPLSPTVVLLDSD